MPILYQVKTLIDDDFEVNAALSVLSVVPDVLCPGFAFYKHTNIWGNIGETDKYKGRQVVLLVLVWVVF